MGGWNQMKTVSQSPSGEMLTDQTLKGGGKAESECQRRGRVGGLRGRLA
jgi:hypothetical protein